MRSSRNQPVGDDDLEINTLIDVTFDIVEGDVPHLVDYFALSVDEGHPEVEGTMGQYDNADGGMYLVESIADVAALEVKDVTNLTYSSSRCSTLKIVHLAF